MQCALQKLATEGEGGVSENGREEGSQRRQTCSLLKMRGDRTGRESVDWGPSGPGRTSKGAVTMWGGRQQYERNSHALGRRRRRPGLPASGECSHQGSASCKTRMSVVTRPGLGSECTHTMWFSLAESGGDSREQLAELGQELGGDDSGGGRGRLLEVLQELRTGEGESTHWATSCYVLAEVPLNQGFDL